MNANLQRTPEDERKVARSLQILNNGQDDPEVCDLVAQNIRIGHEVRTGQVGTLASSFYPPYPDTVQLLMTDQGQFVDLRTGELWPQEESQQQIVVLFEPLESIQLVRGEPGSVYV